MKLSTTQIETLIDLYYDRPRRFRSATLKSLERRNLISQLDDGYELTAEGLAIVEQIDFDADMEDAINAAFYLGNVAVEKPELIAAIAVGSLLGALVRRLK